MTSSDKCTTTLFPALPLSCLFNVNATPLQRRVNRGRADGLPANVTLKNLCLFFHDAAEKNLAGIYLIPVINPDVN